VIVGNPAEADVRMGPLVSRNQLDDVASGIEALGKQAGKVTGSLHPGGLPGVEQGKGFFLTPHLFLADDLSSAPLVHEREVFGPVVTVMPYDDGPPLVAACAAGGGSLVSSVYSDDRKSGTVLPQLVHGGPGRAGGGEELGGARGMSFYLQRTAIQGYSALLDKFFPD